MLVSDYITKFLVNKNIDSVFGYPGGMVTFMMNSFSKNDVIDAHSMFHEQAAAFAACGYSQLSGKTGVAYATSGPGATNLLTGICHAYYESIPTMFLTGQVNTKDAKGNMKLRQKGFQETDVLSMVDTVTKYSAYVEDANKIRYYLEKAFYYANEGRQGPVLLDIPIDIQRTEVFEDSLYGFDVPGIESTNYNSIINTIIEALSNSVKPVILLGNGINISGSKNEMLSLLDKLNIPVITSMISVDLLPFEKDYNFGFIGSYGIRYSNFIVSQCDLIISLGSRLDRRQTGSNLSEFAKNAKLLRVDIDVDEFENVIKDNEICIHADLKELIVELNKSDFINNYLCSNNWLDECAFYKLKLTSIDDLLPNRMINRISLEIPENSCISTDVGQNQVWVSQSFHVKDKQRILFSGGHGAMGYSLPSAIGAYYACRKPVYCFTGDGGLQFNIQEFQYLVQENIPVKIFIINNSSLGMIRHFQEIYFDSKFTHTVINNGYSCPDFVSIGSAYGIKSFNIDSLEEISSIKVHLHTNEPVIFNISVGETTYVYPKLQFTKPIYDQEPCLDSDLLEELLSYSKKY